MAFCPMVWDTRAAIGTADTPAEPMRGLILPPESLYMSLPTSRPPMVENAKAHRPSTTIFRVLAVRNWEPAVVAPTEMPRKMVTMFIRAFCTVSLRRSVTPHSRHRLPSIRQPIRGAVEGSSRMQKIETMMGKTIFSVLETSLAWVMTVSRSFLVVSSFISGG